MGPSGPPVPTWVEGRVLGPEGRPLGGAEVWLESANEQVLARGETKPDGSFALETSYEADQIPRRVPHKVVARRALGRGVARAEQWIRIPGATRQLELRAWIGFDLQLRFPFAIRSEVLLGAGSAPVRKLAARDSAPTRLLPALVEGEVWVAVIGVDASDAWWAGLRQGRVGDQAELRWEVPLRPLAKLTVQVTGPEGLASPAKLVVAPLAGNRFGESSLQRSSQVLDFAEDDAEEDAAEEEPPLPSFGVDAKGVLSLPPGPWRVSAFGPPGTQPTHLEVEVGAEDRQLPLKLEAGLAAEFELPAGLSEGEVAIHGPAGAYLEEVGESRWRVAGLAAQSRVEVYLLHSEAAPEDGDENGEDQGAPLDEPAPTSCALLRLKPGARERLALVRTASLRVLLPDVEGEEAWEVTVEDAATSGQAHSLGWDLEEDPMTPSGPWVTDDSPQEQVWLEPREGAMTITSFERVPGARARSSDIEDEAILLQDLFPGPVRVTATGPGGFTTTRTLRLVAGEQATLDLAR